MTQEALPGALRLQRAGYGPAMVAATQGEASWLRLLHGVHQHRLRWLADASMPAAYVHVGASPPRVRQGGGGQALLRASAAAANAAVLRSAAVRPERSDWLARSQQRLLAVEREQEREQTARAQCAAGLGKFSASLRSAMEESARFEQELLSAL